MVEVEGWPGCDDGANDGGKTDEADVGAEFWSNKVLMGGRSDRLFDIEGVPSPLIGPVFP